MSKESKPIEPDPTEPATEPEAATDAASPTAVELAKGKVTEAQAAVNSLGAEADALLAAFNITAQAQPVDTARLLELAGKRSAIIGLTITLPDGKTEEQPGKLHRATAALAKAAAALTDATWETDRAGRDAATAVIHDGFTPTRDALAATLPPLGTPTVMIAPLTADALETARVDAGSALHAAQARIALLDAIAGQPDAAAALVAFGCDRLRVAWETLGESSIPVWGFKPVRAGSTTDAATRKPATRASGSNGGGRGRATYTDGGRVYTAREYADAFEPARSAAVQAKIDGGASLSHTHLADSIMKARIAAGQTVVKSV